MKNYQSFQIYLTVNNHCFATRSGRYILLFVAFRSLSKLKNGTFKGTFELGKDTAYEFKYVVDGTYVNESKNAFARYLNESFRGKPISLVRDAIDKDRSLLIFTSFANADAAFEFLQQVQKDAPVEVSWLPANKYSFILISEENLQLLKTNKDIPAYLGVLDKAFPGRF